MEKLADYVCAGTDKKGDVQVWLKLNANQTQNQVEITSSMEKKYGKEMRATVTKMLDECKVQHADLVINDNGAFNFVLEARLECALKRALTKKGEIM